MPFLGKKCTNNVVKGICLNFKWLLHISQCENWCRTKAVIQLNECLLLGLKPKNFVFHSILGNFTQRPSAMRESQHKPLIKIGKAQKSCKALLEWFGTPILNYLDLSQIHMHALIINDVSHILDLVHAKGAFLQVGT